MNETRMSVSAQKMKNDLRECSTSIRSARLKSRPVRRGSFFIARLFYLSVISLPRFQNFSARTLRGHCFPSASCKFPLTEIFSFSCFRAGQADSKRCGGTSSRAVIFVRSSRPFSTRGKPSLFIIYAFFYLRQIYLKKLVTFETRISNNFFLSFYLA